MFGWLFKNPRITAMTRVVHEMSSYPHHMKSIGGELHSFFAGHPMLKNHHSPTPRDRDQIHTFYLSDGTQGFKVLVCEGQPDGSKCWISIAPDGDFQDAHIQSTQKGEYIVNVERYPNPRGRLAVLLVDSFVKNYDAANATIG